MATRTQTTCTACGGSSRRIGRGRPDGLPCIPCDGTGWITAGTFDPLEQRLWIEGGPTPWVERLTELENRVDYERCSACAAAVGWVLSGDCDERVSWRTAVVVEDRDGEFRLLCEGCATPDPAREHARVLGNTAPVLAGEARPGLPPRIRWCPSTGQVAVWAAEAPGRPRWEIVSPRGGHALDTDDRPDDDTLWSDLTPAPSPVLALPPEPGVGVTVEVIGGRRKGKTFRNTGSHGEPPWRSGQGEGCAYWTNVLTIAGPEGVRVVPAEAEAGEH